MVVVDANECNFVWIFHVFVLVLVVVLGSNYTKSEWYKTIKRWLLGKMP